jgi:hypothetical protein
MRLDLGVKGELSTKDSLLIDRIAPKVYDSYNNFITQLVADNSFHKLDFLLSIVSRNPLQSSILPTFCKVALLQEKLKKGDTVSEIIVDNSLILEIVNDVLSQFGQKIPVKINQKKLYIHKALFVLLRLVQSIYLIMISWLWPRLSGVYKKQPKGSIVLVDNFVLSNSFTKEGVFFDRYYSNYSQYLSESQNKKIWYSPTLVGFKSLFKCLEMSNQSKNSRHNFLFQESWLTLRDYIHALYLTIMLPFKMKRASLFMGCNVRKFLISEARKDIFSPSLIKAICKFKFIKNLKSKDIEICHVVDWHENQNIDKALNLGFHKYYPDITVKGYQGYIAPPYWTHTVPQSFELKNSLLPSQLYVISENRKKFILASCPDLDVRVASAFRFSYLYDMNRIDLASEAPTILITLPIDIYESEGILNACVELHSLVNTKINILVKQHPTFERHAFAKLVPLFLNSAFILTDDSMAILLGRISLLISSASSTCAEAASLGIPVAVYGNRYGVTMNPIADIESTTDNVFYSQGQLAKFIDYSLTSINQKKDIEQYFLIDNGESAQTLFACE